MNYGKQSESKLKETTYKSKSFHIEVQFLIRQVMLLEQTARDTSQLRNENLALREQVGEFEKTQAQMSKEIEISKASLIESENLHEVTKQEVSEQFGRNAMLKEENKRLESELNTLKIDRDMLTVKVASVESQLSVYVEHEKRERSKSLKDEKSE